MFRWKVGDVMMRLYLDSCEDGGIDRFVLAHRCYCEWSAARGRRAAEKLKSNDASLLPQLVVEGVEC